MLHFLSGPHPPTLRAHARELLRDAGQRRLILGADADPNETVCEPQAWFEREVAALPHAPRLLRAPERAFVLRELLSALRPQLGPLRALANSSELLRQLDALWADAARAELDELPGGGDWSDDLALLWNAYRERGRELNALDVERAPSFWAESAQPPQLDALLLDNVTSPSPALWRGLSVLAANASRVIALQNAPGIESVSRDFRDWPRELAPTLASRAAQQWNDWAKQHHARVEAVFVPHPGGAAAVERARELLGLPARSSREAETASNADLATVVASHDVAASVDADLATNSHAPHAKFAQTVALQAASVEASPATALQTPTPLRNGARGNGARSRKAAPQLSLFDLFEAAPAEADEAHADEARINECGQDANAVNGRANATNPETSATTSHAIATRSEQIATDAGANATTSNAIATRDNAIATTDEPLAPTGEASATSDNATSDNANAPRSWTAREVVATRLTLTGAATPREEMRQIARDIRARLNAGASARQFGVFVPDAARYAGVLEAAFREFQVPVRVERARSHASFPVVRRALSLLQLAVAAKFSVAGVSDVFGDGLFALRDETGRTLDARAVADLCRAARLQLSSGDELDDEALEQLCALPTAPDLPDALPEPRALLRPLLELRALGVRLSAPRALSEVPARVRELLGSVTAHLRDGDEFWSEVGPQLEALGSALETVVARHRELGRGRASWLSLLGSELESCDAPLLPLDESFGVVRVSSPPTLNLSAPAVTYIAGLLEGEWPDASPKGTLFSRHAAGFEPLRAHQPEPSALARHGLALALCCAREVHLSYPMTRAGRETSRSPLAEDALALWPDLPSLEVPTQPLSRLERMRVAGALSRQQRRQTNDSSDESKVLSDESKVLSGESFVAACETNDSQSISKVSSGATNDSEGATNDSRKKTFVSQSESNVARGEASDSREKSNDSPGETGVLQSAFCVEAGEWSISPRERAVLRALEQMRRERTSLRAGVYDGVVGANASAQRGLQTLLPHPSARAWTAPQLGRYARCGFRFWHRDVLRLRPLTRSRDDLPRSARGRLLHRIVEEFELNWARTITPERFDEAWAALSKLARVHIDRLPLRPILREAEAIALLGHVETGHVPSPPPGANESASDDAEDDAEKTGHVPSPRLAGGVLGRWLRSRCAPDDLPPVGFAALNAPKKKSAFGDWSRPTRPLAGSDHILADYFGGGAAWDWTLALDDSWVTGRIDRLEISRGGELLVLLDEQDRGSWGLPGWAEIASGLDFNLPLALLAARDSVQSALDRESIDDLPGAPKLAAANVSLPEARATGRFGERGSFGKAARNATGRASFTRGLPLEAQVSSEVWWDALESVRENASRAAQLIAQGDFSPSAHELEIASCETCDGRASCRRDETRAASRRAALQSDSQLRAQTYWPERVAWEDEEA